MAKQKQQIDIPVKIGSEAVSLYNQELFLENNLGVKLKSGSFKVLIKNKTGNLLESPMKEKYLSEEEAKNQAINIQNLAKLFKKEIYSLTKKNQKLSQNELKSFFIELLNSGKIKVDDVDESTLKCFIKVFNVAINSTIKDFKESKDENIYEEIGDFKSEKKYSSYDDIDAFKFKEINTLIGNATNNINNLIESTIATKIDKKENQQQDTTEIKSTIEESKPPLYETLERKKVETITKKAELPYEELEPSEKKEEDEKFNKKIVSNPSITSSTSSISSKDEKKATKAKTFSFALRAYQTATVKKRNPSITVPMSFEKLIEKRQERINKILGEISEQKIGGTGKKYFYPAKEGSRKEVPVEPNKTRSELYKIETLIIKNKAGEKIEVTGKELQEYDKNKKLEYENISLKPMDESGNKYNFNVKGEDGEEKVFATLENKDGVATTATFSNDPPSDKEIALVNDFFMPGLATGSTITIENCENNLETAVKLYASWKLYSLGTDSKLKIEFDENTKNAINSAIKDNKSKIKMSVSGSEIDISKLDELELNKLQELAFPDEKHQEKFNIFAAEESGLTNNDNLEKTPPSSKQKPK